MVKQAGMDKEAVLPLIAAAGVGAARFFGGRALMAGARSLGSRFLPGLLGKVTGQAAKTTNQLK